METTDKLGSAKPCFQVGKRWSSHNSPRWGKTKTTDQPEGDILLSHRDAKFACFSGWPQGQPLLRWSQLSTSRTRKWN